LYEADLTIQISIDDFLQKVMQLMR